MTDLDYKPRAAVIFRTHFWDAFAQRQFDRLIAVAGGTDVFILVDETSGPVAGITHDKIVRVTEGELLGMGLANAGEGALLWFNGDYPLYKFQELHGDYDYYLQLEYDVVINGPILALIASAASQGVDFVGLTKGEATPDWPWVNSCTDAYDIADISHQLICLALFSSRALRFLAERRLALSDAHQRGKMAAWPMCEGFIATELLQAGMVCKELSEFGDTDLYDHWPPYLEADTDSLSAHHFIHPVLDESRFVSSMLKYHIGLKGFLNPASLYHRKLRRLPTSRYLGALAEGFIGKVRRNLRRASGAARQVMNDSGRRAGQGIR